MSNLVKKIEIAVPAEGNVVPVAPDALDKVFLVINQPHLTVVADVIDEVQFRIRNSDIEAIHEAFHQEDVSFEDAAVFLTVALEIAPLSYRRAEIVEMLLSLIDRYQCYDMLIDKIPGFRAQDFAELKKGEIPSAFQRYDDYDFETDQIVGFHFE